MTSQKFILKRGRSESLVPGVLVQGELGFNTDTDELWSADEHGKPVKVAEVIRGPDDGLYMAAPDGYYPLVLSIKGLVK